MKLVNDSSLAGHLLFCIIVIHKNYYNAISYEYIIIYFLFHLHIHVLHIILIKYSCTEN